MKRNSQALPARGRLWTLHILLPLVPNLSPAALLIYLKLKGMFRYLKLFNPDVAWVALIGGSFAAVWSVLRTALMLRALKGGSGH